MAILNTSNTMTDGQAKTDAKPEVAKAATEHLPATTPAAKRPRQSKAKLKPAGSDTEPAAKSAQPNGKDAPKANRNDLPVTAKPKAAEVAKSTKAEQVLKKLRLAKGATIEMLTEATGWQAHSVRGFLSAVVKKKLGLNLVSEVGKDGARRYRIDDSAKPE